MSFSFRVASALLASASMFALSPSARAQEEGPVPATADESELVVTGSRVIRNGNNSPTPVTVISTDEALRLQPGTLADALQVFPAFAGSRGSGSNPTFTGGVAGGNGSANQLNLRNIGLERTLVLQDGKRVPPTLFNGIVDVDIIPQMLVSRVDVVTGGAGAVYGSDAVAGVVNYIINHDFSGLRIDAEAGVSAQNDAEKYRFGIAWGAELFGGRGHFVASYEYQREDGIPFRSDRDYMRQWGVTGAGTTANPYVNQADLRQRNFAAGGRISSGALADMVFGPDGTLHPFLHGTPTGTAAIEIGGEGAFHDSSLLAALEFNQAFARFDYDFSSNLHGYVQFAGNFKTNQSSAEYQVLQNMTMRRDNPFLHPSVVAALTTAGQSTFRMNQYMMDFPRSGGEAETDQWTLMTGLNGRLGRFDWAVDYVHGDSELSTTLINNLNNQNLAAALDAVRDLSGNIICYATLVDPTYACEPLNIFGPGVGAAAAYDYITDEGHYTATTVMDDVSAQISGSLFNTWAGPVNVALSGEWRTWGFESETDTSPGDPVNCTNIRANCPTALHPNTFATTPEVSNTVWETAFEFDAPLLAGVTLVHSLNLNGAVRYTSYETSGDYTTWKLGLDWHISNELRVRATRSRDIRAPTLNDLFAGQNLITVSPTDLLTGLSPNVFSQDGSNPSLTAEIGDTSTAGIVWRPTSNFSIALDGYRIIVSDAITRVQGADPAIQNACYASAGTSPYCALQLRPLGYDPSNPAHTSAANAVTQWRSVGINIAEIETYGADLEVNYRTELFERPLALRLLTAWQPHIYYRQPGIATRDQGGAAFGPLGGAASPSWRVSATLHFEPTDQFSIDLLYRWRNDMRLSGIDSEVWLNNRMSSFDTTNVTLTYEPELSLDTQVYFNIQNIFDNEPPGGGFTGNGTRAGLRDGYASGDHVLGRYFTLGVRIRH
jgi:iron complex outermembrane receptor protein